MMSMAFYVSGRVTLLFDFWDVEGPVGMLLSVLVVTLLAVFYELFKVWRVWLETKSGLARPTFKHTASLPAGRDGPAATEGSQSELSLTPAEHPVDARTSWVLHVTQASSHVLQVTLGYLLMLCVMSYNAWIFLAVLAGSGLGYFISLPLLNRS